MTDTRNRETNHPEQGMAARNEGLGLTRRTVLAGAAATAAVTFGPEARADNPPAADVNSAEDVDAFVAVSAALTGIAAKMLAPDTDSLGLRRVYFNFANSQQPALFAALLQIAKRVDLPIPTDGPSGGIIKQGDVNNLVQAIEAKGDDTKYLARSIVLMWYLGAWYDPQELKKLAQDPTHFVGYKVISSKAYTQGWLWRVAQAHPMGYSDMQFGYWTRDPEPLSDFIAIRSKKGA